MASHKMTLMDWLDDLCVRFLINLPTADLSSMERICFLVEEAHWFYEDFCRPLDHTLPSMNLRSFCLAIFQRWPLMAQFPIENHIRAFEEFLKYKTSVPVRGAILLNETLDMALLVKGWRKGAAWSFPKGKIAMAEDDLDCAIREVFEETGFDVRVAGLVPPPEEIKYIETTFRDQHLRLYVFRNVPMDTYFEPKTRKEISKIAWYKISDLPSFRKKNPNLASNNGNQSHGPETDDPSAQPGASKFFNVAPFVGPLKKWVAYQKKRDAYRAGQGQLAPQPPLIEEVTEDELSGQPEPLARPYQGTAPPESILESASRELQRMLNMKIGTAQAPLSAAASASATTESTNQSKANALLAVLQKGGNSGAAAEPPVPLDQSHGMAPQPPPHHYQYYGQPGPTGNAPVPPFYLQQQNHQYHQEQMALAGQGQHLSGHPVGPRPNVQQQQQHPPVLPPPPPYQQQAPFPQQNLQQQPPQYFLQHPQQLVHPQQQQQQQLPPQQNRQQLQQGPPQNAQHRQQIPQQQYQQQPGLLQQQAPPSHQVPTRQQQQQQYQSVPLLHPQPLPPAVQKGLFARESFTSPDVQNQRGNGAANLPPPPLPSQPQQKPQFPPLSNHAASLLSAFKSSAKATQQAAVPPAGWQQQQQQQPQPQPAQLLALLQQPQQSQQHQNGSIPATTTASASVHGQHQPQHYGSLAQQQKQQHLGYAATTATPTASSPTARTALADLLSNGNRQGTSSDVEDNHIAGTGSLSSGAAYAQNLPAQQQQQPYQPQSLPPYQQHPIDQRRSALLDIFKKDAPTEPPQDASNHANGASRPEAPAARVNGGGGGGPPMQPNLGPDKLAFDGLSLLSRAKEAITANGSSGGGAQSLANTLRSQASFNSINSINNSHNKSKSGSGRDSLDNLSSSSRAQNSRRPLQDSPRTERRPSMHEYYGGLPSHPPPPPQQAHSQHPQSLPLHPHQGAAHGHDGSPGSAGGGGAARWPGVGFAPLPTSMADAGSLSPAPHNQTQQQQQQMQRQEPSADQKQKLLSLFGKAPLGAATGAVSSRSSSSIVTDAHVIVKGGKGGGNRDAGAGAAPGSTSAATTAAALMGTVSASSSASRRGSAQTPISPADRNFLLGYLASMSGAPPK